ncbi:MAG TPA: Cof-type HAD-IIB family hydrolase [Candidatus Baltobacteraceae bacterium]
MTFRLVALDLDGTLIGPDLEIKPRVARAIHRMRAEGVAGCIVTGRMYRAALPYARALGFVAPIVCYQGAAIVDPQADRVLFDAPLDHATVAEVIHATQADGVHLQLYRNDSYYCEERNRFSELYARLSRVEPVIVPSLSETFALSDATKAVVVADPPQAERYAHRLSELLGERAYVTRSYPQFVEVLNPNVDKGRALTFVAQHLGIGMDDVLAVGDAWNDAPLLRVAGFGVAMGSAPEELRAEADAVVPDVAGDGVAQAIEQYVLR